MTVVRVKPQSVRAYGADAQSKFDAIRNELTDERFRRACRDEVTVGDPSWPWWKRCIPRRAEGEFAADIRARWEVDAP